MTVIMQCTGGRAPFGFFLLDSSHTKVGFFLEALRLYSFARGRSVEAKGETALLLQTDDGQTKRIFPAGAGVRMHHR